MKYSQTWLASQTLTLILLVYMPPVAAVILDPELETPKPVAKPTPAVKPVGNSEYERLKKELEKERMQAELYKIKAQKAAEQAAADAEEQRHQQEQQAAERKRQEDLQAAEQKRVEEEAFKLRIPQIINDIEMVELPSGLKMGKYEVTQGQWRAVMGSNPASRLSSCGENCPIDNVSWDDVQQFIQQLNSRTGKRFRLPTEDEWYTACQIENVSIDFCGSSDYEAVAWYEKNSKYAAHPVGQKQPNSYGLYDMSGNVAELTSSCYEENCSKRIYRGGDAHNSPHQIRNIWWHSTSERTSLSGFRLAQDH